MIPFAMIALAMTALALLFILPGFLRKSAGADHQVQSDQLNLLVLRDQLRELDADRASGTIGVAYDSARADLERRVAEDVQPSAATGARTRQLRTAIVVGVGVPVLAGLLYFFPRQSAGSRSDAARSARRCFA
jgi:cytochrome c-type biogenesis protein CcmH